MLIFERSVTKPFQVAYYEIIMQHLRNAPAIPVGNTGVLCVRRRNCARIYVIMHGAEPIAWVSLERRAAWNAWEVHQVFVHSSFRGQGLAGKIYKAIVNNHEIILASGKTQSKSSRGLWLSFVKKRTFNIWAHDFNNLDLRSQVWLEDGELQCDLEVYTRFTTPRDVRLVAIKKK